MSKNQLESVRATNDDHDEKYHDRGRQMGVLIVINTIQLAANIFLGWLAFSYYPQVEYAWTNNAGAVCRTTPVSQPHIHQQIASDFAVQAAISIYSYDYLNYNRSITSAMEKYFTPEFADKFRVIFGNSRNLQSVIDNLYIVSAYQNDRKAPQIARVGIRGGVYFWEVQIPLNVYYVSGNKRQMEKLLATVTVVRTDPSRSNPTGIAVDNITTAQLLE